MSALLLRLAGPLQSWGVESRFAWRATANAPTKSGVIGLLASALGYERTDTESLAILAGLCFGVRLDQPGRKLRDFQTAHHPVTGQIMPVSQRFYVADAVFLAGVEGERALLETIDAALHSPRYLPYLGRRSCPPSGPINLGIHDTDVVDALKQAPWQASTWYQRRGPAAPTLTLLLEADPGYTDVDLQRDQPTTFNPAHRRYDLRGVRTDTVTLTNPLVGADKHSIMLGAGTEASFRHFRVWEALPNADWAKNKAAIAAASQPTAK